MDELDRREEAIRVRADAGGGQRSGARSTLASSATAAGSTASISAITRSTERISVSVISALPSRVIRFDVDSIESTMRPLRFSFARSSSASVTLPRGDVGDLLGDDLEAGRDVLLACAHVDADVARV